MTGKVEDKGTRKNRESENRKDKIKIASGKEKNKVKV